jgi:hypothetical protein
MSVFAEMPKEQLEDLNSLFDTYSELITLKRSEDRTGALDGMANAANSINIIEKRLKRMYGMKDEDINLALEIIGTGRREAKKKAASRQ